MDVREKFFKWREALIKNGELKPRSGRDTCYFKLQEYKNNPCKHQAWMDDITTTVVRSYFAKNAAVEVIKETKKNKEETSKEVIISKFIEYIYAKNIVPTLKDLSEFSKIKYEEIRKAFGSPDDIFQEAYKKDNTIASMVLNEKHFTVENHKALLKKIEGYKKFVVTTAVVNKKVNLPFFKALKNYADINNALILVLPCQDVFNRKTACEWNLDPLLHDCGIVFKDIYLNKNLFISDIKVSAKQINPLTGLDIMVADKGSIIVASPKQFLEFIPNAKTKQSRCQMTTGAVTENDYYTEFYMSQRLSKLAEHGHTLGAVIVEIEDDKIFHFRQLQASSSGSMVDLGIEYTSDGKVSKLDDVVAVLGDIHCGKQEQEVTEKIKEIISELDVKDLILHDVFDCESVNHHHENKAAYKARKAISGQSSLEREGRELAKYLDELASYTRGKLVVVESNHNEALSRYLDERRWAYDSENIYFTLDIMQKYIEGENPLRYMIEDKIGVEDSTQIDWLERDEDYNVHGFEVSAHGDIGANGARGSIKTFGKAYKKAVIGHRHTPGIWRNIFAVGTSSSLDHGYNVGLSSWSITLCLIYSSGSAQLLNLIKNKDGNYCWRL